MRIILFTGKGGVGKTTTAAATATLCSELGYRTLIMSTDPAHSLSDCFDFKIASQITKISNNLFGLEINAEQELRNNWEDIQNYVSALFVARGLDEIIAEELAVFPGINELFSLLKIKEFYDEKYFDLQIIDCAPTAESLAFLTFPDISKWYMEHLFPIQKRIGPKIKPMIEKISSVPLPGENVYTSVEKLYVKLSQIKDILTDKNKCSIRLVLNPEKMVIKEAQRAFTYFHLFGFRVDAVIVNRIIPLEVSDEYFSSFKRSQLNYLNLIQEAFSPLPIFKAKLFNEEVIGIELLKKFSKEIYNEKDPSKIFYQEEPISLKKEKNSYVISLDLPFAKREDLEVIKKGEELLIKVGPYKREIVLPRAFFSLNRTTAKFEDQKLKIKFEK